MGEATHSPLELQIAGTGSALPKRSVSNAELIAEHNLDSTPEWIFSRTGIERRHIADETETTATLATKAGRLALEKAGLTPADVDMVLVATSSPDKHFPATAHLVQAALHIPPCPAFDMNAACNGFMSLLSTAEALMRAGKAQTVLLIGAETLSRLVDWTDRSTCILFGDGAGALILKGVFAGKTWPSSRPPRGLLGTHLYGDGRFSEMLHTQGGPGSTGQQGTAVMNGREVFRHAVRAMSDLIAPMLAAHHLSISDMNWLIPHQANRRILEATAKAAGLPVEKVIMTLDAHANTSAASIPLALDEAARKGTFHTGDILLLEAFGAGFSWGGAVVRW